MPDTIPTIYADGVSGVEVYGNFVCLSLYRDREGHRELCGLIWRQTWTFDGARLDEMIRKALTERQTWN